MRSVVGLLVVLLAHTALADPPIRIRMAALAPEGTPWAREFHTIDRELQAATHGHVQMKWYLGGIAGDENAALERVRRGQLDGEAGALFCERLAPSLRVGHLVGLFQGRDEWKYVMGHLVKDLDREFAQAGFTNLGVDSFGTVQFFSRYPIRTVADLKRQRFWTYDLDDVTVAMLRHMGVQAVSLPVADALKAYDDGRVDGFVATAAVALAWQWSARASYYSDLRIGELPGCLVIAQRTLDALSLAEREAVRAAVAKFVGRFDALSRMQDDLLLNGLFERQGLKKSPASPELRDAFLEAAHAARDQLGPRLVPPELLHRATGWLADYRVEHGAATAR